MKKTACLALFLATPVLASPTSNWQPEPSQLSRLASTVSLRGFSIRPPKGYTAAHSEGPKGSKMYSWLSKPRADGMRSYVMMVVMPVPPQEKVPTSTQALDAFLKGIKRRREKDWKQSPIESGKINGVPFVRAHWWGTQNSTQNKMAGVNYMTVSGRELVQLSTQEVGPTSNAALKMAEASILTFRRTGA